MDKQAVNERTIIEILRSKMCGPHQECDEAHDCTCRDGARSVMELLRKAELIKEETVTDAKGCQPRSPC